MLRVTGHRICRRLAIALAISASLLAPSAAVPAAAARAAVPVSTAAQAPVPVAHIGLSSTSNSFPGAKPIDPMCDVERVTADDVCDPGGGGCEPYCTPPPPPGCDAYLGSQSATRGDNPEFGGPYSHVAFSSRISCSGGPQIAYLQARLWDRTSGNDGYVLATGPVLTNTAEATSGGSIDLYDIDWYPYAQSVEQIQVMVLVAPSGSTWAPCNTPPQSEVLWCNGVGTETISIGLGWISFVTGVTSPCSDPNRTRTDTDSFTFTDIGMTTTFTPHIKWCWSGTRIFSVIKEQNTGYVGGLGDDPEITRTVELVGNDSPTIDNSSLPQAGRYHAEFIITFKGTDIDGPYTLKDRIQIDRTYLAGGTKEKDDKWLSFTFSRP